MRTLLIVWMICNVLAVAAVGLIAYYGYSFLAILAGWGYGGLAFFALLVISETDD